MFFFYQNIIVHYKYLNDNLRTFVEFLDQLIYAPPIPGQRPLGVQIIRSYSYFCSTLLSLFGFKFKVFPSHGITLPVSVDFFCIH